MRDIITNIKEYTTQEVVINKLIQFEDGVHVLDIQLSDKNYIYKRTPLSRNSSILNKEQTNLLADRGVKLAKIECEWEDTAHRHMIMEKVSGKPFYKCMTEGSPSDLDISSYKLGQTLSKLHYEGNRVININLDNDDIKEGYIDKIEHNVAELIHKDTSLRNTLHKFSTEIKNYMTTPDMDKFIGVIHGDLGSPFNIMAGTEEINLIDLDTFKLGFQLTDVAHVLIYPDMNDNSREQLIRGYVESGNYEDEKIREAIRIATMVVSITYAKIFGKDSPHYKYLQRARI